jgi:hypothetical protein
MHSLSLTLGGSFARSSVARMTTAPSSVAKVSLSVPPYVPIAVRTGEQITTCRSVMSFSPLMDYCQSAMKCANFRLRTLIAERPGQRLALDQAEVS